MMVPFVDFMNHLTVDTTVDVWNLQHSKSSKRTNYSLMYSPDYIKSLEPEFSLKITGAVVDETPTTVRSQKLAEIKQRFVT